MEEELFMMQLFHETLVNHIKQNSKSGSKPEMEASVARKTSRNRYRSWSHWNRNSFFGKQGSFSVSIQRYRAKRNAKRLHGQVQPNCSGRNATGF